MWRQWQLEHDLWAVLGENLCFCWPYLAIFLHLDRNCTADLSREAFGGITFISFTRPVIKMTSASTAGHSRTRFKS